MRLQLKVTFNDLPLIDFFFKMLKYVFNPLNLNDYTFSPSKKLFILIL